jgi:CheY-like chemotaxis protein
MNRKRRKRKEESHQIIAEQAAAYGISLPGEPSAAERFLSPNDIGKILNLTGEAVKQWIYQRRLPAVKLANGYWKVKVADFEAFLKARHEVGRRRVLIICSKEDPMTDVVETVQKLGHQPITSNNYADALLKSLDHHPALFVVNCSAKETEPWKLVQKIRATKALRSVPVLLTAEIELSESDAEKALELAAQGFLKRPSEPQALYQEIERILNRTL